MYEVLKRTPYIQFTNYHTLNRLLYFFRIVVQNIAPSRFFKFALGQEFDPSVAQVQGVEREWRSSPKVRHKP